MFCHHCGTQVPNDVQFCPSCGQSLGTATPLAAPAGIAWTPPAGVRSQTGRWIGMGWDMVKQDMGMFVLLAIVFSLVSGMVPIILQGPLMCGFHLYCMKKLAGRRAEAAAPRFPPLPRSRPRGPLPAAGAACALSGAEENTGSPAADGSARMRMGQPCRASMSST